MYPLLNDLLASLGVWHKTTSAMAPSVKGAAEAFNKWIAGYLKTRLSSPPAQWEGCLATMALAYNTTLHSATKQEPFTIIFGRPCLMPQLDPLSPPTQEPSWPEQQSRFLQEARLAEHRELGHAANCMMAQNPPRKSFASLVGEQVLLYYTRTELAAKGCPKLQRQWVPATVLSREGPLTYRVRPSKPGAHITVAHLNRLKPQWPRTVLPSPSQAAPPQTQEPSPRTKLTG